MCSKHNIQIGQQFRSYNELQHFLSTYEEVNSFKLYLRDSKTLENQKLVPLKVAKANKDLKYYYLVYGCSRGGRNFKTRSTGLRNRSSLKQGCDFKLRFALSEDCQYLVLCEINETHNHTIEMSLASKRKSNIKPNYVDEDLAIIRRAGQKKQTQPIPIQPPIQSAAKSQHQRDFSIVPLTQKQGEQRPDHIESQKMYNTVVQAAAHCDMLRCRLCLNYHKKVINIFREDFPKMIEILTSLKMDKSDTRFPMVACLQCAKDVKNSIAIRKRIIHSQKTLIEEFKNQILQCVMETEQAEHNQEQYSIHSEIDLSRGVKEEPIYPAEQPLAPAHPGLLIENNVVYEVEIQTVSPNNTLNEGSGHNEDDITNPEQLVSFSESVTQDLIKQFQPIRPSVGARRKLQTKKLLEKAKVIKKMPVKKRPVAAVGLYDTMYVKKRPGQGDTVSILPLAKRKQILAEYQKRKEIERRTKKEPTESAPKKVGPGRKKPINPLMTSRIRQRLIAIRNQQTEVFPKNEKIPCSVCQKIVLGRNMIKHMEVHSNEPIKCTLCDAICKNGNSLQSHIFYYHKCKADEFVCDECGRAFRFKYKFMLHKKIHHGGEKDHQCQHCGKKFFTNVTLIRHIKAVHKKIKSHFCEYCGKGFQSKYGLRTHVRVHTLEAPYQCTFCDECFRQKVSLRNHLRSKHNMEEDSTIFCETCGKGFSSDVALASHVRKLHEVQKCPQCSESFASAEFLNKHLQNVHGEAPNFEGYESRTDDQQCPLCSKVFANSDVLNNHMQNMHGVSNMTLNLDKSGARTTMTLNDFI